MGHLDLGPSSAKEGPEDASPGAASASTVSALLRWCHSHPPCLWLCGHCNSIFTDPEGGREGKQVYRLLGQSYGMGKLVCASHGTFTYFLEEKLGCWISTDIFSQV